MGPTDQGRAPARREIALAAAAALAALAWGLLMAPRGYAEGDGSELTIALALAGVPHPTGYPLYTLAGHVATTFLHALGVSWPAAANAWSALGSAVALFFLARLALALAAPESRAPRSAGGLAIALALFAPILVLVAQPPWSNAASGAEVYSWHAAWVTGTAWLAWRLAARAEMGALPGRAWLAWGLALGAGLAHHATSLLVSLPLTVWLVRRASPVGAARLAAFAAGSLLPLLSWGWIAYRAVRPAAFQWPLLEPGLRGLLNHVAGRAYGGYLGGFHPSDAEARLLVAAIPWLVLALAAALSAASSRAADVHRSFVRALGVAIAGQTLFVLVYRVPDPSAHLLPILAIGTTLVPRLALRLARRAGGAVAALAAAALLLLLLPSAIERDLAARADAESTDRIVRAAWESIPFERGVVVWNNDLHARLRAYQILEGSHPERIVAHPGVLSWEGPRRRFQERHGFDPWDGAPPASEEALAGLAASAARAGRMPAVDFDDAVRAVRAGGWTPTR
ncbi:MAG TPA: DUF2723 domain-containing protein [Candidatus Eisenbacteria bacterium]|nr:DUF2723 domain-containing protein [Candidatus Eisenbacteria bacterium]